MNELFQSISNAITRSVADLVDTLFRLAFWQLLAGAVLLTLSVAVVSSLSDTFRGRARIIIFVALALVALQMLRPLNWTNLLG
jgi:hypothetical protein